MSSHFLHLLLSISFFILVSVRQSDALATMAIDLGSEFMKVAIVKPGVPMEVALDSESSRKTATIVTLRNGERLFGNAAVNMAIKFPGLSYQFIPNLLGKNSSHPDVVEFLKNFPYYKVEDDVESGQLVFEHAEDGLKFTSEELLAMLLEKARDTAEKHSGFPIKAAVITVPAFTTQATRRAIIRAAKLCELNVLQLMSDSAAVALNYGVFRYKSFNTTAQYYMFYDMGASSTTSVVVEYKTVKHKEDGLAVDAPQLAILGVGYDPYLGTVSFAIRLRDHFANKFNELKKTGNKNVKENPRAMAKLYREAMRVLKVLSANQETTAQVENVMDDIDMKVPISRNEFQELCSDLFDRVAHPVDQAINSAQLPLNVIQEMILMGGGTRIPKVQEVLLATIGRTELGKSINSDEAAALGAVYQAAHLSPGFRVKRFLVKDANIFPIQVSFHRAENHKLVTRTLFTAMNLYPQKKALTFNRMVEDFPFFIHHDSLSHLPEIHRQHVTANLSFVKVKGVVKSHEKHLISQVEGQVPTESDLKVEPKGIKAHFELDSSGILVLHSVEALYEKSAAAVEAQKENEKSAFEKIGSTISNFFGSNSEEKPVDGKADNKNKEETNDNTSPPPPPSSSPPVVNETSSNGEGGSGNNETTSNSTTTSSSASGDNSTLNTTTTPPKNEIVSEPLKFKVFYQDRPIPSDANIEKSIAALRQLRQIDDEKRALEKSRNDLEGFIFDMRDRFTSGDYEKCSTEEERETFLKSLNDAGDWYEEQGMETPRQEFDDKLKSLKSQIVEVEYRVQELRLRPEAFKKLFDMLNTSHFFHQNILNFTGEANVFTQIEADTLEKLISETTIWMEDKKLLSEKMKLTEKPSVLISEINAKGEAIQRELQYLINKINIWKSNPPPPPPPPKSTTKEESKKGTKTDEEATATASKDGGDETVVKKDKEEESTTTTATPTAEEPITTDLPPIKEDL